MIIRSLLCAFGLLLISVQSCQPGPDGQFNQLELGSPANVTAPLGSDIQFICCGGTRWTYENKDEYLTREIGPHPDAAGAPDKTSAPHLTVVNVAQETNMDTRNAVPTTVYTMHDDKGRLFLIINNADMRDMGHYRCHGSTGVLDAFLVVTPERYTDDQSKPAVIEHGSLIPRHVMFSSDQLNKVILHCPITDRSHVIQSWLWREPILPSSEEFLKVPQGKPPSRTVTANRAGLHEGGHVEIGPNLAWARIVDPLSPEAPVKLWCQFEKPVAWDNKEPVVAYYVLDWELYEPIAPKVFLLPLQEWSSTGIPGLQAPLGDATVVIQTPPSPYDVNPAMISHQIEQAEIQQRSGAKVIVLEHKPARFVCRFRKIDRSGLAQPEVVEQRLPPQQVYWYRGGQSVHVPPFHVDNSLVTASGLSILDVRSYPTMLARDGELQSFQIPRETITCAVTSEVKSDPVYKVTTNASLDIEVILVPQIINRTLLLAERSLEDAVKLTCVAVANGPPEMILEFSKTGSEQERNSTLQWQPVEPRYGLSMRHIPPDRQMPTVHRLVLDISDVRRTDHGLYRCTVWNQAGRTQATGQVLVRSPPELSIIPQETNYFVGHKPWIASCHVTGYPLTRSQTTPSSVAEEETTSGDQGSKQAGVNSEGSAANSSVQMKIMTVEGERMDGVEINLIKYEANDFLGINATYEVHMNQRFGNEAVIRCEYIHTDNRVVYQELFLREATKPPAPNITLLCAGPKAVVFGVTNPRVHEGSLLTERIVTQKVIFAPAKTFHNSGGLASLLVYLNSEGQPSASPINRTTNITDDFSHATVTGPNKAQPQTAIIPVKGLMADTEYVFEWSSGNVFGLSAMVQFTLWTTRLENPPVIKNVFFHKPTNNFLRISVFLADPCPYGGGARAELSDLLVRYRQTMVNESDPSKSSLIGVGEWTEMQVCQNLMGLDKTENSANSPGADEEQLGIKWAGDTPLPCEIPVEDAGDNYEPFDQRMMRCTKNSEEPIADRNWSQKSKKC
ncbi:hypothetical protein CRM22_003218 [Opisthorchis felineus]|uniref:Ig-like domain-containing protein n=1 Tax=Opisthorchis felineus TaxID=147828 RepID=A0A4S2M2B4_OPIFE|nr:hypothetical protein CRM22_003218 [Opisthorchis felineus]